MKNGEWKRVIECVRDKFFFSYLAVFFYLNLYAMNKQDKILN